MKKMLFIAFFAICGLGTANAQSFNAGVNLGLPAGDADMVSSFVLGGEVNYMFTSDDTFNYGVTAGINFFFKKDPFDNASFLPIAASGRYNLSEDFVLGADLGYALGLSPSGNDGGFYYRPMLGYNLSEKMMVTASYSTVNVSNGGGNWGSFGVGLMFGL